MDSRLQVFEASPYTLLPDPDPSTLYPKPYTLHRFQVFARIDGRIADVANPKP